MRLLIVDDSVVFRSQIRAAVESSMAPDFIGIAQNGKIAIQKLEQDSFDVMTLDLEMPEMSGIEVLREIKRKHIKIKVIIFAAQTARSAKSALDALNLGAIEIVAKPNGDVSSLAEALEQVKGQLIPILKQFHLEKCEAVSIASERDMPASETLASKDPQSFDPSPSYWPRVKLHDFLPKAIVIGSSTGGPAALEVMFSKIKGPIQIPIFLVQHMPPVFTAILAQRIQSLTGIECSEAKHGEQVQANHIYIAPGDYHMRILGVGANPSLSLDQGPKHCYVRPAVDYLFEDAAKVYESQLMAFVLTGMGEDGALGCKAIKSRGGGVMIQDKASSTVWGMPGAVHAVGSFDKMASLDECAKCLASMLKMPQNRM